MRLKCAQWYEVIEYWPKIEGWVERALAHGRGVFIAEEIKRDLLLRDMTLWVVLDGEDVTGFSVTQMRQFPRAKVMLVLLIGGKDMKKWRHLMLELEDYARSNGCSFMEGTGRRGWKRAASPGWEPVTTVYRRTL